MFVVLLARGACAGEGGGRLMAEGSEERREEERSLG